MSTPLKRALSRRCAHVCLLITALASSPLNGQTSATRDGVAQRPAVNPQALDAAATESLSQKRQQLLQKQRLDARSASAKRAIGGVVVAARCVEGFVVSGQQRASAQDVRIVSAAQSDCAAGRCRAYQVTATRDNEEPFDLEVSVTCS